MTAPRVIGHLTVRIPIRLIEESESPEIPEIYTYLDAGPAELIYHDVPASWHPYLRDELVESGGIEVGEWGPEHLAATTTMHELPKPAEPRLPDMDLDLDLELTPTLHRKPTL